MVVSEKWEHIDVSKKFGTEITITESTLDEIVEAHQVVDDESLTEVGYWNIYDEYAKIMNWEPRQTKP